MPFTCHTVEPGTYVVREGERPAVCAILLGGFAYRHKVTGDGQRQIVSIHMPGDFLDLQNSFLDVADHNVQALTRCEMAYVQVLAVREIAALRPQVGRAMWLDTLIDAAVFREWIVNVGRRDSLSRISHLLCELGLRLEAAGLAHHHCYELPMTQEQIADCTGLTPVHVNRMFKNLGLDGLISRTKRSVTVNDWKALAEAGDFESTYLHLPEHKLALTQ